MKPSTLALALCATWGCAGKPGPITPTLPPPSAPPPVETARPAAAAPAPPVTHEPDVPAGAAAARDAELAARAAPIVDASLTNDGELTPDGRRLVFVSNRDGLPQLYVADARKPSSPATRLVASGERVQGFLVTDDGRRAIYLSDKGADERWSVFSVGLDGKAAPVELTPGEALQRGPSEPVAARGKIYYGARDLAKADTALHELALTPDARPRVVMTSPLPLQAVDVSNDGRVVAAIVTRSISDAELQLVDVATGAARKLYPTSGTANVEWAGFSPDGRRVHVATDGGGEQALLLSLDVASGKELARHVDPAPSLDWCTRAARAERVACRVLVGHRAELRTFDGRTLKPIATAKLPPGTGHPAWISADGARVVAVWSTPSAPHDLFAVDARTGQATALRADARPGLEGLPELDVTVEEVKAHDGLTIPVIVSRPAGGPARKPVIVEFHGGPAGVSVLSWRPLRRFFTALGYAYVEPNVRGSSGYGRAFEMADDGPRRAEAVKDIETTGRWVAAQPWADPERLVILGGSYGGYSVLMGLTRWPATWRAGVNLFGVASWKTLLAGTSGMIRQILELEIGNLDKDGAFLESMSPLRDAGKIVDPLFVYAGANDPRVPRAESDAIVRALRARGVPVEYMVAANEGHSLARRENLIAFLSRSARFLEGVLK